MAALLRCATSSTSHARQAAIAALLESPAALKAIVDSLDDVCDIERIVGATRGRPRRPARSGGAGASVSQSLPELFDQLRVAADAQDGRAGAGRASRPFCAEQADYLAGAIMPDPAPHLREGGVIADRLRRRARPPARHRHQQPAVAREVPGAARQPRSNIPSLKVGFNKVFGYYIEVTHAHRDKVPADWIRKQTVKNAERYITAGAEGVRERGARRAGPGDRAGTELFEQIRQTLLPHVAAFQEPAYGLAQIDVLAALAELAQERRYCRPRSSTSPCWRSSTAGIRCSSSSSAASSSPTTRSFGADDSLAADHRPEHGRQEHLHPPGRADRAAGADRQLRPGQRAPRSASSIASSPASARATS